jgi:hypothetical protein
MCSVQLKSRLSQVSSDLRRHYGPVLKLRSVHAVRVKSQRSKHEVEVLWLEEWREDKVYVRVSVSKHLLVESDVFFKLEDLLLH